MVTQSMKRMAFRVTESAVNTFTEDSQFTPVVAEIRQAMLIHKIVCRLSRGSRANAGAVDCHSGLTERSFDAEPDFDDEDVVFMQHGGNYFTGTSGEPDLSLNLEKTVDYGDIPLVYVKPKIYAYVKYIATNAIGNAEIEIFYTVKTLTKDEWIGAISEGL